MSMTETDVIERTEQPDPLIFNQFSLVIPDNQSLDEEFRKVWRRLSAAIARIDQLEATVQTLEAERRSRLGYGG